MKTKSSFLIAACLVAAACARTSEATEIVGKSSMEGVDQVHVIVSSMDIDTYVPVENGRFSLDIPADPTVTGVISAGSAIARFVPDGTKLKVTVHEDGIDVESDKKSVHSGLADFVEYEESVSSDLNSEIAKIRADETLDEEEKSSMVNGIYDEVFGDFKEYAVDVIKKNSDNVISLVALKEIYSDLNIDETEEILSLLSEKISADPLVQNISSAIAAKKRTAEGKMFIDFTAEKPDGEAASLSDYVGRGKYILVDFWASWCGPCKREIPYIKAVYEKHKGSKFDVLSVAVWDRPEDTAKAAKEHGVVWKQIVNAQSVPTERYGIEGIPHIILFGPDGTILKRGLRGAGIEEAVSKYVD